MISPRINDDLVLIMISDQDNQDNRCSIVVSIPAYHAGDPGSIPGNGANLMLGVFKAPNQML